MGKKVISRIEWSWSGIHVSDEVFDWMLPILQSRFLSGGNEHGEHVAGGGQGAGTAAKAKRRGTPASRGSGRLPPAVAPKAGRGSKRTAGAVPVVPVAGSIRGLRHRSAAIKMEKGLDIIATALLEEEARTSVVRPPFVIGHVKPFSAWPHGGVVVFAQFPFLLDQSWRLADKWLAYCRKVSVLGTGGRYEVMFAPKETAGGSAVAEEAPRESSPSTADALRSINASGGGASASAADVNATPVAGMAAAGPSPTPSEAEELLEVDSDLESAAEPSPVSVVGATGQLDKNAAVAARQATDAPPVVVAPAGGSDRPAAQLLPTSTAGTMNGSLGVAPEMASAAAGGALEAASAAAATDARADRAAAVEGVALASIEGPVDVATGVAATAGGAPPTPVATVGGAPAGGASAGGAPAGGAMATPVAPVSGAPAGGAPGSGALAAVAAKVGGAPATVAATVAAGVGGAPATGTATVDGAQTGGAPSTAARDGPAPAATATESASAALGAARAAVGAAVRDAQLSAVQRAVAEGVPGQFTPMPEPLQYRLGRALREGKMSGDIEEGEQVEWCVLARSPAPVFSMLCTFSSALDLGRSQTLPCGTHRSNNYITGAYPARDPKDQDLMEMEW